MAAPSRRLSICGLAELDAFCGEEVTHVLSILDPEHPDPEDFARYGPHERLTLRFDDIIAPVAGMAAPEAHHIESLLAFGEGLTAEGGDPLGHLLVHCHAGVSRSTASMAILLAEARPHLAEELVFAHVRKIRPQAWPNSRMVALADEVLGRQGRLTEGLRRHYREQMRVRPELARMIADVGRGAELEMARGQTRA